MKLYAFDETWRTTGYQCLAGVDEAGRGPWAGPVVASAVILPPVNPIKGINDSKKLDPRKREQLFEAITASALAVGVGIVHADIIDSTNILEATFSAMREALARLAVKPDLLLVDGNLAIPAIVLKQRAVVGGDALSASIAAASIVAKVTRDRLMAEYAREFPHYGFDQHKGYGTKDHLEALRLHGPCALHRKSFAPIRKIMEGYGVN